eukprot:g41275.t1
MNLRSQLRPSSWSVRSHEILDDKGYPIGRIQCLSSEVISVFRCGTLELAINELNIVYCSYKGVLQHLQVSVSFLIRTDPVYAQGLSVGDGCFNMFRVEARKIHHRE